MLNHKSSFLLSCFMMFTYNRINKRRDNLCRREKIDESRREEFTNLGDASPLFR